MFMDAVCYAVPRRRRCMLESLLLAVSLTSCLTQRLVSRFGRATRVAETTVSRSAPRSSRETCSARAAALARRRRARDLASVAGHCCLAWTCTSGIESPAFTMAASERERFAAGGSVFALYEACGRAYNNDKWQCQPSEGEALSGPVSRRRGVTSRTRDPSESHNSAPNLCASGVRH